MYCAEAGDATSASATSLTIPTKRMFMGFISCCRRFTPADWAPTRHPHQGYVSPCAEFLLFRRRRRRARSILAVRPFAPVVGGAVCDHFTPPFRGTVDRVSQNSQGKTTDENQRGIERIALRAPIPRPQARDDARTRANLSREKPRACRARPCPRNVPPAVLLALFEVANAA
jgi:hypothetical protein